MHEKLPANEDFKLKIEKCKLRNERPILNFKFAIFNSHFKQYQLTVI